MYGGYQHSAARTSTSSTNTSNSSQGGYVVVLSFFSTAMSDSPIADEQRNPGDVPTAVRNLLLSTKQLQKSLSQWSLGQVSETQVSDVYVKIGQDFNNTIQAFAYHRIDLRCAPARLSAPDCALTTCSAATSTPCLRNCARSWNNASRRIRPRSCWGCSCPRSARSLSNCCAGSRHGRRRGRRGAALPTISGDGRDDAMRAHRDTRPLSMHTLATLGNVGVRSGGS